MRPSGCNTKNRPQAEAWARDSRVFWARDARKGRRSSRVPPQTEPSLLPGGLTLHRTLAGSTPASAARARAGGRERRVGLRKPALVPRNPRPASRHSGGPRDGPIGFPKAPPSLPPGERAVRVRTETLPKPPRRIGADGVLIHY